MVSNLITKLIDQDKWDKVLKLIKSGELDGREPITNGNTVLHMASIKNIADFIVSLLKYDKTLFEVRNDSGDTPIHLLAQYGYVDTVKKLLKKDKSLADLTNDNGDTIVNLLVDTDILDFLIKLNIDIDHVNNEGMTLLLECIDRTGEPDDFYHKQVKTLLLVADTSIPSHTPPLLYTITKNKKHIFDAMVKKGTNINIRNDKHVSPLILATYHNRNNIVKSLIKHGADINYNGPEGDENLMAIALKNGNNGLVDLLIDNGYDLSATNRFLDTPAHMAFSMKSKLSNDKIKKIINNSDLNASNKDGDTPLHLMVKNGQWKNFNDILESKKLDVYATNNGGETVLNSVKSRDYNKFLDIVSSSFVNRAINKKCSGNLKRCRKVAKKMILDKKISYPDGDKNVISKIRVIKEKEEHHYGLFNADAVHNIIYTLEMLRKYPNLGVPFQYKLDDKYVTELNQPSLYRTRVGEIISNLVRGYRSFVYELSPYLIVWRDKDKYFLNKNLKLYMEKMMSSDKVRFILFKLTLVPHNNGTHANIIIYDKKTGWCDRFDPYGNIPYLEQEVMDKFLEKEIRKMVGNHKFEYLAPGKYMGKVSFQTISDDSNSTVKKLGDPPGYCLAWTFWYLEMRLQHPEIHPKTLVEQSLKDLLSSGSLIDFIRNYARGLDKVKNKYMTKFGIDKSKVYKLVLDNQDEKNLSNRCSQTLLKLMDDRLD